jgi:cell division septum initiation protein DivIVA
MTNSRRKLWNRGMDESEQLPEREEPVASLPTRIEQATGDSPTLISAPAATPDQTDAGGDDDASADLADVGAEVGTVLKTAQEAAVRIRRQAREEAAKMREEAKTAAGAELAEARRLGEADRAEGARLRTEAEADAESTRAEAETFAQELRTNAEREADRLLEEARQRMGQVDAEIERRLREGESEAQRRRDTLQAESKLYEKRLEKMLGVFHGMTTQLEQLLGIESSDRRHEGAEDGEGAETLEAALQPDNAASSRGS